MSLATAYPFIIAGWTLNEASGARTDSVGSNSLTDNNTVGSATGMFGNAADFESTSSQFLDHVDNATLSVGDIDWEVRFWTKLESKTDFMIAVGQDDLTLSRSWAVFYDVGTDRWTLFVRDAANTTTTVVVANNFGSPPTGVFSLIHAWHDATNNTIGISVNAGTPDTASYSLGVNDSTTNFSIGCQFNNGTPATFFDGLIDDLILMKGYILDATERTEDWNSGAGVAFANWAPASPFIGNDLAHRPQHQALMAM